MTQETIYTMKKPCHLRYNCMAACMDFSESRHPQEVMKQLGITYQHVTPQSLAEQFWFWNCENVPDELPEYITILTADPIEQVGYGLSKTEAEKILAYKSNPQS